MDASGDRRRKITIALLSLYDQGLTAIAALLSNVLLARSVSVDEFGIFSIVFAVWLVISGMMAALLVDPISLLGATMKSPALRRYGSTVVLAALALNLAFAGPIVSAMLLMPGGVTPSIVAAAAAAAPFIIVCQVLRRLSYLRTIPGAAALGASLQSGASLLAIWYLFHIGRLDSVALFLVMGAANLVGCLGMAALVPLGRPVPPARWRALARRHWDFGAWLAAGSIANWAFTWSQIPILGWLRGLEEVAVFRAHLVLFAPIVQFVSALLTPLSAAAARCHAAGDTAGFAALIRQASLGFNAVCVLYGLILLFFGETLMRLLYAEEAYSGHRVMIFLVALLAMVNGARQGAATRLYSTGNSRALFTATALTASICPVATVLLILGWGGEGAMAALILGFLVLSTLIIRFARRADLYQATDRREAPAETGQHAG